MTWEIKAQNWFSSQLRLLSVTLCICMWNSTSFGTLEGFRWVNESECVLLRVCARGADASKLRAALLSLFI
jgi:hypothetical protein